MIFAAQVTTLSTGQVAGFTAAQVATISLAGIAAMSTQQIAALTPAACSGFTASQLAVLTAAQIAAMPLPCVASLRLSQLYALAPWQIGALTPLQVAALTKVQVCQLTSAQVGAMCGPQLAALSNVGVASLSISQLAAIAPGQLASLTPAQAVALSRGQIAGLSVSQVTALAPSVLAVLTPQQTAGFTATVIAAMTTAQIAALSTSVMAALTLSQVAALQPSQLVALSGAQLGALSRAAIAALTVSQVAALQPAQLAALSTPQLAALTSGQVAALSRPQAGALRATQLAALSSANATLVNQIANGGGSTGGATLSAPSTWQVGAAMSTVVTINGTGADLVSVNWGDISWFAFTAQPNGSLSIQDLHATGHTIVLNNVASVEFGNILYSVATGTMTTIGGTGLTAAQANAIIPAQVAALTAAQVAALTPAQLAALTPAYLAALTQTQIAALTAQQIASLAPAQVAAFTPSELSWFSTAQLAALTPAQLIGLTPGQIAVWGGAQIAALGTDIATFLPAQLAAFSASDMAALTLAQVAALGTAQVAALSAAQISALTPAQMSALTAPDMAVFSASQLAALSDAQLNAIAPGSVAALTGAQVAALGVAQVADLLPALATAEIEALTTAQIAALSPATLATLSSPQFAALDPSQIAAMSPTDIGALTSAELQSLTMDQLAVLTASDLAAISQWQIPSLSVAAIAGLSLPQLAALSTADINQLTPAQLYKLSDAQLSSLSPADIAAIVPGRLESLNTAQIPALTAAQIAALSQAQVNALLPAQIAALATCQVADLSAQQITALSGPQVAALTGAQLAALSVPQVQALTSEGVGALTPGQVGSLSAADIAALIVPGQIAALSAADIAVLSVGQASALSASQLAAFTEQQAAALSAADIAALSVAQIAALPPDDIAALTGTQLAALSVTQLQSFSSSQAGALSDAQRALLTPAQLAALVPDSLTLYMAEDAYQGDAEFVVSVNGQQVGGVQTVTALKNAGASQAFTYTGTFGAAPQVTVTFLNDCADSGGDRNLYVMSEKYDGATYAVPMPIYTDEAWTITLGTSVPQWTQVATSPTTITIPPLTVGQVQALLPSDVAALTPAQIEALTTDDIAALTAQQLAALSPAQIGAISTTDLAAMTPAQIGSLTAMQLAGLSTGQAAALSQAQLAALTQLERMSIQGLTGEAVVPQAQGAGAVVGLTLQNASATALAARIISFGQTFAADAVPAGQKLYAIINGVQVAVQMDVKTTYADGSVKMALLTLQQPALAANASANVMLTLGGASSGQTALNIAALTNPATYNTVVALALHNADGSTTPLSYNVGKLLQQALASGGVSYWQQGPLATQVRFDVPVAGSMHLTFDVTLFADGSTATDVGFNNDIAMSASGGTVTYDATITQNGAVAFQQAGITEYQYQTWNQIIYSNGAPQVNVQQDIAALERTGAIQNYDLSAGVSNQLIATEAAKLGSATYGVLGSGDITQYMPQTGGRPDIGVQPQWVTAWLMTQNATAAQYALAQAGFAGSVPWSFYDPTTGGQVTLTSYPTIWDDPRAAQNGMTSLTQSPAAPSLSGWTPDPAHEPDLTYVAYMMTGDRVYLDQLNAEATYDEIYDTPWDRNYAQGIVANSHDQVRQQAWSLREVVEAAAANPNGSAMKAYFTQLATNNIQYLLAETQTLNEGQLSGWLPGTYGGGTVAPWEQDFLATSIGMAAGLGIAGATQLLAWETNFIAGLFLNGANGFLPTDGANYNLELMDPTTGLAYTTWAQAGAATAAAGESGNGVMSTNLDYIAAARAALADSITYTGSPLAMQAYGWLAANGPLGTALQSDPTYNIVPRLSDGQLLTAAQQFIRADATATTVQGGPGDQLIYETGPGNVTIIGGPGIDILFGGSGTTTLIGGAGNDFLYGGSGATSFQGGGGNDYMQVQSGSGAATFIFATTDIGSDILAGFRIGTDHLQVAGASAGSSAASAILAGASDTAGGALLHIGPGETVTLQGLHVAQLGQSLFG